METWSRAMENVLASRPNTGGALRSLTCELTGCNTERRGAADDFAGGEFGGVTVCEDEGGDPAGQYGRCLFGTGVEVRGMFKVSAGPKGGGVGLCLKGAWCCWTTTVAIFTSRRTALGIHKEYLPG